MPAPNAASMPFLLHMGGETNPSSSIQNITAVNVSSEAETFAIRSGISKATALEGINQIIVTTDSIQCAQKLFDTSNHSLQGHTIAMSHCLRAFSSKDFANSIQFWGCPSDDR